MAAPINRRTLLAGLGAAATGSMLAACGAPGSSSSSASNADKTTNKLIYLTNSDEVSARGIVDRWNKSHKLQTQLRQSESGTYSANFGRLITGSDAPNLASFFADGGLYTDLAKAGSLADLSDFWKEQGLDTAIPALIKDRYFAFTDDNKAYGVPTNSSRYGLLFYRKSVLAKAGVAEPANHQWASMAEFEAACDALKAAGLEAITVGGKDGYPLSHLQDGLLSSTMAPEVIGDPKAVDYTSAEWTEPVAKMLDWANKDYFARGYLGRSTDQSTALFGQSKAGFNTGMNVWQPLMIDAGVPLEDLDWCLLPPLGDLPTKVSIFAGGAVMVPTIASARKQALEFAAFLLSKEQALITAKDSQVIPARSDVDGLADALGTLAGSMVEISDMDGRSQFGWDDAAPTEMITYDRTNLQAVLAGTLKVDAFGAALEKMKAKIS